MGLSSRAACLRSTRRIGRGRYKQPGVSLVPRSGGGAPRRAQVGRQDIMTNPVSTIASGLASWAEYEFLCTRGYSFSERYFTKPLHELTRASFDGCSAFAEWIHPNIVPPRGRRGAKPKIDVVAIEQRPGVSRRDGPLKAAIEMKWCGRTSPNANEIAWDLFRLAALSANNPDAYCVFVLLGITGRVSSLLEELDGTRRKNPPRSSVLRSEPRTRFGSLRHDQLSDSLARMIEEKEDVFSANLLSIVIKQSKTVVVRTRQGSPRGITAIASKVSGRIEP